MYKFITIAVGIYIIYYVWRAYSNMKNLKKNMDDNPKELTFRNYKLVSVDLTGFLLCRGIQKASNYEKRTKFF